MYTAQTGQLRRKRRDIKFIPKEVKDRTPEVKKAIKIHSRGTPLVQKDGPIYSLRSLSL